MQTESGAAVDFWITFLTSRIIGILILGKKEKKEKKISNSMSVLGLFFPV